MPVRLLSRVVLTRAVLRCRVLSRVVLTRAVLGCRVVLTRLVLGCRVLSRVVLSRVGLIRLVVFRWVARRPGRGRHGCGCRGWCLCSSRAGRPSRWVRR